MLIHPASSSFRRHACIVAAMLMGFLMAVAGGCAATAPSKLDRDAPLTTRAEKDEFRELLLAALDREALYTLAGGLKPLSTGFWRGTLDLADPDTAEIARVRRALAPLRNEMYYADVQAFANAHEGQRHLEAYIIHRASFVAMIEREQAFWSPLGVTPCTHPAEVVAIVDRLPRADRWRAYGFLFGYPRYAIDFFVEAGERPRSSGDEIGPGKDREFFHVPTYTAPTGRFTWAVPLGHVERPEDRAIRERAAQILESYRRARPQIVSGADPMAHVRRLNSTHEEQSREHADAAGAKLIKRWHPASSSQPDGVLAPAGVGAPESLNTTERAEP